MPGVYNDDGLGGMIRQLAVRLRGLETQQQSVTSDNKGRPIKTTGLVPGSNPQLYGDMYWDPITGAKLMFQGYDSGADAAYTVVYDASGNPRVRLGPLPDGDYGLAVYSPANDGTYVELSNLGFGLQSAEVAASQGTTATGTYVDLATPGPSVTVTIGTSGRALVTGGADIIPGMVGTTGDTGYVGLNVDGTIVVDSLANFNGASGTGVSNGGSASTTGQRLITGLSAGSHTFKLQYVTLNGSFTNFGNRVIAVQPF